MASLQRVEARCRRPLLERPHASSQLDGIAVNALCPGCVDDPSDDTHRDGCRRSFADAVPAGRYASAAEIADVAAYLALEAPLYLTGAAIVVDGALRA